MTQEVFELVQGMDLGAVETQLALYCAPLITGLKMSNLLMIQKGQLGCVQRLFSHTGIACFVLYRGGQKAAALLYRPKPLYEYLKGPYVKKMFCQLGYKDFTFGQLLLVFAGRYAACMEGRAEFPHEMGLFLGYPIEDVEGFIENGGKNFLCAGYWKVYKNKAEKIRLFHTFDLAKERLISLVAEGVQMSDIIRACP